jgi:hypothetical protein
MLGTEARPAGHGACRERLHGPKIQAINPRKHNRMNPTQIDREQTQGDLGEQDEENQENQRNQGNQGNQSGGEGQRGQQTQRGGNKANKQSQRQQEGRPEPEQRYDEDETAEARESAGAR